MKVKKSGRMAAAAGEKRVEQQENVVNDSIKGGASVQSASRSRTCKFCRSVVYEEDEQCACRGTPVGHKKLATLRNYMELLKTSAASLGSKSPKVRVPSMKYK